tara:strand:+ start:338 stop:589 length:252 start_codon:yes stop_codon:yes gene_type:complete
MSYQKTSRRLTIALETNEQIKNATKTFYDLAAVLAKISRSPNSERNKLHMAQYEVMSANGVLKSLANGETDSLTQGSYYKKAT